MNSPAPDQEVFDILVVEDNRADIILLKRAFAQCDVVHHVHVAMDADEAMGFLSKQGAQKDAPRPALILLDLNLPGKNGDQILAEIKQDDGLRQIPVVMLTSSQNEDDVLNCYNLHANAYMTKACDFREVVELARKICEYWLTAVKLPPSPE